MNNKQGMLRFGVKSVMLIGALALIFTTTVGGTLAWMFDRTTVTNTFTIGEIAISLTESDMDEDGEDTTNSYSFYVGAKITKDAIVTVKANSEDCWLFVKVEESENFNDFMEYQMADGWIQLDANQYPGIWYQQIKTADTDVRLDVLKNRRVLVKTDVSQQQLDDLDEEEYPALMFSAYAVQSQSIDTAAEAWNKVSK